MLGRFARRHYSDLSSLRHTPFYDLHIQHGGKMVDYAGFAMPVLYNSQSHVDSHNWVRQKAGLFDVSHMVQHKFVGPDATKLLETVTPGDLTNLKPFTSTLSVLLNQNGGIVDDTIITKHGENDFYVVTNAGCREKDLEFLQSAMKSLDLEHSLIGGGLIALQGPQAATTLQGLTTSDLNTLYFGESRFVELLNGNIKAHVARGGYTGEDGFEISIEDSSAANEIAGKLLANPEVVKPIGLAARDTLRLEAGMCLYGHELTESIGPVEARLAWTIGKSRREGERANWNGSAKVLETLKNKSATLRSGIISTGPAPRQGAKVFAKSGELVGEVTSGSMSPTLKKNVSMAYLPRTLTKSGSEVDIEIRGKKRPGFVTKLPFVEAKYYRPAK